MSKNDKQTPIQLEVLLSLKRQEQPDAAFWVSFEEKLHQKTLQALVKPEPLLTRLARRAQNLLHPAFAMPAAAALAVVLFLLPSADSSTPSAPQELAFTSSQTLENLSGESQFAANSLKAVMHEDTSFTQLQSSQSLTTDTENIQYVASTYTAGSSVYSGSGLSAIY